MSRILVAVAAVVFLLAPAAFAQPGSGQKAAMGALELAKHHYKTKNYKEAARLFHQAYKLHPLPGFLFNAARAEQRAFMLSEAEAHYKELLALKEVDEKTRKRAQFHLGEVSEMRARLAAEKKSADQARKKAAEAARNAEEARKSAEEARHQLALREKKKVVIPRKDDGWKEPAGYATVVVGLVAAGVGGYFLDQSDEVHKDLVRGVEDKNEAGKVIGLSKEEYDSMIADKEQKEAVGVAALGVGVVALGAGAWMLLTRSGGGGTDSALSVRPGLRHLSVAWRF